MLTGAILGEIAAQVAGVLILAALIAAAVSVLRGLS